jgi:hypothetical protein
MLWLAIDIGRVAGKSLINFEAAARLSYEVVALVMFSSALHGWPRDAKDMNMEKKTVERISFFMIRDSFSVTKRIKKSLAVYRNWSSQNCVNELRDFHRFVKRTRESKLTFRGAAAFRAHVK